MFWFLKIPLLVTETCHLVLTSFKLPWWCQCRANHKTGDVIVNPYIGNLAQECNFLTGENGIKTAPFLDWIAIGNPVIMILWQTIVLTVAVIFMAIVTAILKQKSYHDANINRNRRLFCMQQASIFTENLIITLLLNANLTFMPSIRNRNFNANVIMTPMLMVL